MTTASGRPRRWLFHLVAVALVLISAAGILVVLDVYVHYRLARYAALNIWGYRGPVVGRKRPGERRIVVVGGSTTFGVGFPSEQAFPARLEQELRTRSAFPVSVVNLGFPGENAYAFRANLEDYRYLKPDAVVFYGDNNIVLTAPIVLRHESAVFRLTGYYPLLPTAMREKAMALKHGGNLGAAYRDEKVVFDPGLAARTGAAALAEAAAVADSLHKVLGPLTRTATDPPPAPTGSCGGAWEAFCDAMSNAISYARSQHQPVLVVNQPYMSDRHIQEQQALQAMLAQRFGRDDGVRYLDLGWAVDLNDPTVAYDGAHLTPKGNQQIAERLTEPVRSLLAAVPAQR
jgi:GDSL-like lipase/acylhydrolase family protein